MHASAYKHAHIYINKVVRLDRIVSHDIIHIPVAERERSAGERGLVQWSQWNTQLLTLRL
jgi:hypothetical protein